MKTILVVDDEEDILTAGRLLLKQHFTAGACKVWVNGELKADYTGKTMHDVPELGRWKIGLYKSDWNGTQQTDTTKRVWYCDQVRRGDATATLESMTPTWASSGGRMPISTSSGSTSTCGKPGTKDKRKKRRGRVDQGAVQENVQRTIAEMKSGGTKLVLENVNFLIERGDRIVEATRLAVDVAVRARCRGQPTELLDLQGLLTQLADRLYGWEEDVESNAVEVHVHDLRVKIGRDAIETVRGLGYRLRSAT